MRKHAPLALLAALLLFGCEAKQAETTQTVDWYSSHDAERAGMLKTCHNNPGELGRTPNCINASTAERIAAGRTTVNRRF